MAEREARQSADCEGMTMTKTDHRLEGVLHFEAHPKSVKRALKATLPALEDVDVHASDKALGEHGKTTLVYRHALNEVEHRLTVDGLTKQANIEEDLLLRDDPDEEDSA